MMGLSLVPNGRILDQEIEMQFMFPMTMNRESKLIERAGLRSEMSLPPVAWHEVGWLQYCWRPRCTVSVRKERSFSVRSPKEQ